VTTVAKSLGYVMGAGAACLYLPIICKIINSKSIEGFSTKSAEKIIKNIPLFKKFIEECAEFFTFKEKKKIEGNGKKYVFSGFRDKDLEDYITQNGGQVLSTVSSKTDALIVLNVNISGGKIQKARELNIKIIEKETFNKLLHKIM
jgi:NAD-dependent DNA ligase